MTTTQNYNPLLSALRELTSAQAFRWYGTQAKTTATLAQTIAFRSFTTAQRLLSDSNPVAIAPAVVEPENAKAPHQEYAQAEATEAQDLPVPDGWEAIEADDTMQAQLELDDSASDCLAIDEPEQAIASTELQQAIAPHQEYAKDKTIALEPDFDNAIAGDSEAVPLDDEDTELRYWAELELPSILDEDYSYLENDTDNSAAGAEAED